MNFKNQKININNMKRLFKNNKKILIINQKIKTKKINQRKIMISSNNFNMDICLQSYYQIIKKSYKFLQNYYKSNFII